MVKQIYVCCRQAFRRSRPHIKWLDKGFYISIACSDSRPLLRQSENKLPLVFDDIDRPLESHPSLIIFDKEMAKTVYNFVKANLHRDICVVHCQAGISRSGAIGAFVADMAGIPYGEFKFANPHILENGLVTRLLNEVRREMES